jgi:endonuclease/exonuclease/phosphatase family metal-dependent hydrolase
VSERLRIATYNLQDFFLLLDRDYGLKEFEALSPERLRALSYSIYAPNKPKAKLAAIADQVRRMRPDVLGVIEVGGMESLRNFNRYYLGGDYDCYLHEENSRRGIYAGALVRRGRFDSVEARSVRGRFSRNLLELNLRAGRESLRVYVLHLKSHRGTELGIEERVAEVRQLASILPREGCVVMGDFNGILVPGQAQFEFEPLLDLPLRDVLEARGAPRESRFTHFYFAPEPRFNQLDYILCTNDIEVLRAKALVDFVPMTRGERDHLPSDHVPLFAQLRLGRPGPLRRLLRLARGRRA